MKVAFLFIAIILFLGGCAFHEQRIAGNYVLLSFEENETVALKLDGAYIDVVPSFISGIGVDEEYIQIEQTYIGNAHIRKQSDFSYYVIPLINPVSIYQDENKIGPMTLEEFLTLKDSLGIKAELKKR